MSGLATSFPHVVPERARRDVTRRLPPSFWPRIAILVGLFALIFWPSLRRLFFKTAPVIGEPNWQHAMLIPVIGIYYLYVNRAELLRRPVEPVLPGRWDRPSIVAAGVVAVGGLVVWIVGPVMVPGLTALLVVAGVAMLVLAGLALALGWGVGSLVFGLLAYAYGVWPLQNDYVKDLGGVVAIFGTVLTLCGWAVMRVAWFPIAFLVCAIPWPGLVYSLVASPLQVLAARVAAQVLQLSGVEAVTTGTKIIFERADGSLRELGVAEACAGLKSLMTFITLAATVAFLSPRPLWQRAVLVASAVPIAIGCNVTRVAGQGLLDRYVGEELSQGFAHQFAGLVMMIPAFALVLVVAWVLDNLFVDDSAAATSPERPTPTPAASDGRMAVVPPPAAVRLAGRREEGT